MYIYMYIHILCVWSFGLVQHRWSHIPPGGLLHLGGRRGLVVRAPDPRAHLRGWDCWRWRLNPGWIYGESMVNPWWIHGESMVNKGHHPLCQTLQVSELVWISTPRSMVNMGNHHKKNMVFIQVSDIWYHMIIYPVQLEKKKKIELEYVWFWYYFWFDNYDLIQNGHFRNRFIGAAYHNWLVVLEHFLIILFFHILGISSSQLTHIFRVGEKPPTSHYTIDIP